MNLLQNNTGKLLYSMKICIWEFNLADGGRGVFGLEWGLVL